MKAWALSLLAMIALAFTALSLAPADAEAGCSTTSVCSRSGRYSSCRTSSVCSAPRVRRCTFVNRCTPQRTCVSRPGYSACSTRDVCRRVEVCS